MLIFFYLVMKYREKNEQIDLFLIVDTNYFRFCDAGRLMRWQNMVFSSQGI